MSYNRDTEPSLDFYELRRRHEEYKNSKRQPKAEPDADAQVEIPAEAEPLFEEWTPARAASEPKAVEAQPEDLAEDAVIPGDSARLTVEDFAEGEGEPEGDDDENDDDEETSDNPNPFDPFLRAFKGIRGRLGKRFGRGKADDEDDEDADYDDEDDGDYDEETADAGDGIEALSDALPEEAAPRIALSQPQPAEADEADVEDVLESAPARWGIAPVISGDDADLPEPDEDDEDEEDEEDEEEEDRAGKVSGFKKFLRLFVVPIDEDEADADEDDDADYDDEDDEDEDDEAPRARRGLFRRRARDDDEEDEDEGDDEDAGSDVSAAQTAEPAGDVPREADAADDIEGGPDMSDLNNVNAELTNELAAELGTPGMSRRERRELALRQAAQKAAEGVGGEAQKQADALAGGAAQAVQAAEQKIEAVAEKALEPDAVADVASGIVNIEPAKDEYDAILDEPTREYKAVSKQSYNEFMEPQKDDEEDEDEDEEEEKPARRGLFGRRRKVEEEDDEDEDDYDDEDDEDEEEEEKPRRGLFGRRRKEEDEEEEDEDDDDYDEDDEDEEEEKPSRRRRRDYDDEYDEDEYDDDEYEDDYDDYDDDDGTSFGHVLLGILKGFLTAVMLLLFVVVVLNVLNIFNVVSMQGIARRLPTRMVNVFLPSENMKKRINVEAEANAAPLTQETPAAEAPAEIPQAAPAEPAQAEVVPIEEIPAEAPAEAAPAEGEGASVG